MFPWIKAEARSVPKTSDSFCIELSSVSLGRIFEQEKTVFPRNGLQCRQVSRLPIQVHWNNGPRSGRDCKRDFFYIDIVGPTITINKNEFSTSHCDCFGGGDK